VAFASALRGKGWNVPEEKITFEAIERSLEMDLPGRVK
jgi:hypothetical protein